MKRRHPQSGYALLLMLLVLLTAGVAGLGRMQSFPASTAPDFTAQQYVLQMSRQSLLSYATLYPFLYGPRGAGPGHFPCPDTDTLSTRSLSSNRDGPNPPCGAASVASGRLPRQVNLPGHRYVFHVEPDQRLEYFVSTEVINNPVNRMVNDELVLADQQFPPFLAWIRYPSRNVDHTSALASQLPITRRSVLPGIAQSVAAWLVQQFRVRQVGVCMPVSDGLADGLQFSGTELLMLVAEPVTRSPAQGAIGPDLCREGVPTSGTVDDWLLEGVSLASHWFVRNGWHDRIVLQFSKPCIADPDADCRLVLNRRGTGSEISAESLYFRWQEIS